MSIHIDTWPWKIAIVLALIGAREFVRMLSPRTVAVGAGAAGANVEQDGEGGRWLIETLDSAAIAIGLVLFVIQPFILQAFFIPSGSMENTLLIGDRLLVSKLVYRLRDPKPQDVVVFKAPQAALESASNEETDFIKRCVGTPGDVVEAKGRRIFNNGKLLKEPYQYWQQPGGFYSDSYDMKIVDGKVYAREYQSAGMPGPWQLNRVPIPMDEQARITSAKPGRVPDGFFLMLGDHRNNSNDGHNWGFVPRANIVGKAVCVFWPPTRLGLLDRMSFKSRSTAPLAPASMQPIMP